jgi:hypothetical protein
MVAHEGSALATGDDERHRMSVLGANVNEIGGDSVNLGESLRQSISGRFAFAAVVVLWPKPRELNGRETQNAASGQ